MFTHLYSRCSAVRFSPFKYGIWWRIWLISLWFVVGLFLGAVEHVAGPISQKATLCSSVLLFMSGVMCTQLFMTVNVSIATEVIGDALQTVHCQCNLAQLNMKQYVLYFLILLTVTNWSYNKEIWVCQFFQMCYSMSLSIDRRRKLPLALHSLSNVLGNLDKTNAA